MFNIPIEINQFMIYRTDNRVNYMLSMQILDLAKAAIKPLNYVDLFYLTFVQEIKPN